MPRIKLKADDFVVEELALYDPTGTGDTTLVRARKRDLDTEEVARRFALELGIEPSRVGFAGRKDRRSISSQWFSIPGWDPALETRLACAGVEILEVHRHADRLRPGDLRGNRFEIRVREVGAEAAATALDRWRAVAAGGLANHFGRQRFGAGGTNPAEGRRILRGELLARRRHAGFLIAALQAELFNQAIARRPAPVSQLLAGDLVYDHRRARTRPLADPGEDQALADDLRLSPTGPMYGSRMRWPQGAVRSLEEALWAEQQLPDWRSSPLPRHLVPAGGRRPLRVPVEDPGARRCGEDLLLRFVLPPGSYATVLIAALFEGEVDEGPAS